MAVNGQCLLVFLRWPTNLVIYERELNAIFFDASLFLVVDVAHSNSIILNLILFTSFTEQYSRGKRLAESDATKQTTNGTGQVRENLHYLNNKGHNW